MTNGADTIGVFVAQTRPSGRLCTLGLQLFPSLGTKTHDDPLEFRLLYHCLYLLLIHRYVAVSNDEFV